MLPGAIALLRELLRREIPTAVASSSRNAGTVVDRLQIRPLFNHVIDGNQVERTKPDPEGFLLAAKRLGKSPGNCVVVEDAEMGVDAALAAEMSVVGIGPEERVGKAHLVVDAIADLTVDQLLGVGA
jgi:HAD superfamily hydrolase (TIGR01509 family)